MSPRRSALRHLPLPVLLLLVVVVGLPVLAFLYIGADKVEWAFPDVRGNHSAAWLRTRDVAPGDEVAIRFLAQGGYKSVITNGTARFGDEDQHVEGGTANWGSISSRDSNEDERKITLHIPADTPLGDGIIEIELHGVEAASAGGSTYRNMEWSDQLKLPITIRSSGGRTWRAVFDLALAVMAWLVAAAASYAVMRWRLRKRVEPAEARGEGNVYFKLVLVFLLIAIVGVIGQLVFVRQVLRTTTMQSEPFLLSLLLVWIAAFGAGAWRASRADVRRSG